MAEPHTKNDYDIALAVSRDMGGYNQITAQPQKNIVEIISDARIDASTLSEFMYKPADERILRPWKKLLRQANVACLSKLTHK